ncbi:MAG: dUTP diphosphatase [Erysipelotrichaceae bacterium]|nr:dUTP diphosphatase [Erysipelotrichaceae bacterium]
MSDENRNCEQPEKGIANFRVNSPDIRIPQRATPGSAGYDFYAPERIIVPAHGNRTFDTGVYSEIDPGYVLLLLPRSGLGMKGIRLANTVGVIDSDYRNEIRCKLVNDSDADITIEKDDRYMQGIFVRYGLVADDKPINNERKGGMGSTGK